MVTELLILNSSYSGARDIFWQDDPTSGVIGYNVYRAFDFPTAWKKINNEVLPGHQYRDATTVSSKTYDIKISDWVEFGEAGKYGFKLPEPAYSKVVKGQAILANGPDDLTVLVDGKPFRPAQVNPLDLTVWLQTSEALPTGGSVSAFPILDFANVRKWQVVYSALTNFVDIFMSMTRTYYTIVPVMDNGKEQHAPGVFGSAVKDTLQIDSIDYIQQEMVRRNAWIFEQVGEPCHLMFKRTKGTRCQCTQAAGQPRTACPSCFETGIVGGYYGPIDFLYIDPDSGAIRTLEEGGVKVERTSRSYLGTGPIVQDGDLIVRKNGDRLVIKNVTFKSPRGVLLQQEFDTELLQPQDTRYLIPVVNIVVPKTFNPANLDAPVNQPGTEPVSDPTTGPQKGDWENDQRPIGRTVTFGRIQT